MNMPPFDHALQNLSAWFQTHKRILPWRDNPDVYRVWVSEIMLQQTQVRTVIPYYEKFMNRFPSVEELAAAEEEEVFLYWAGLGYYSRAGNLHHAANVVVNAGRFPQNRQEWLELPGIGDYTAGAILSIAQGKAEAILDANVKRVVTRLWLVKDPGPNKKILWEHSENLVKKAAGLAISPSITNQALMEIGALVCLPKAPLCNDCPFFNICKALENKDFIDYSRGKQKEWLTVNEQVAVIFNKNGEVLLTLDSNAKWRKGLWDFPGDIPEFMNQYGFEVKKETILQLYTVTNHKVKRTLLVLRLSKPGAKVPDTFRWVNPADSLTVPVGSPVKKAMRILADRYHAFHFKK